jgi:hypothetical protein
MSEKTKYRLIKFLVYIIIVGFAAAFFWHQMKK